MRTALACLVVFASSCATDSAEKKAPPPSRSGDVAGAAQAAALAAQANAQRLNDAIERANAVCGRLEARPVSWEEERGFGRLLAAHALAGEHAAPDSGQGDATAAPAAAAARASIDDLSRYVQLVGATVASYSSRPNIPWVFGVIDDSRPFTRSEMGGYVFVSRGLLHTMKNEADLAAALSLEIAAVAQKVPVASYAQGRTAACKVTVTGLNLVESGASDIMGAQAFIETSKFGKTFRTFEDASFPHVPDVNQDFIVWFLARVISMQAMTHASATDQGPIDEYAEMMIASAGYDPAALAKVIATVNAPGADVRQQHLDSEGAKTAHLKGKSPAFPKGIVMP